MNLLASAFLVVAAVTAPIEAVKSSGQKACLTLERVCKIAHPEDEACATKLRDKQISDISVPDETRERCRTYQAEQAPATANT